ncbi:MAG: HAD-IA family hydrolase [Pseudomonadota bacterium]|nr:HAD-IA family hydrolase [Pseudomonadota bacterium]
MFDCDGTLVDSANAIIEAMNRAWDAEGLPAPDPTNVRSVVGLHLVEAIGRLHPEGSTADHNRMVDHYKGAFFEIRNQPDHAEPLYEGTLEVLDRLDGAGVLLGVATGKSRRGLEAILDRHGILERFVSLKTSDDGPGKPNPTILHDAMREVGAERENTIMIGDTVYDISMAVNAHVRPIGVNWGYHATQALEAAGAAAILGSFHDLESTFQTLWGNR